MSTHPSQIGGGRRLDQPPAPQARNLSGREGLTYTRKTGVAVGIAGVNRFRGPLGQGAGKRGRTDV